MKSRVKYWLSRNPKLYARLLRWTGRSSPEKTAFLHLVRDGDVVLDIGANRGHFTLLFSHLVGAGGEVHAFEASPDTFRMLTQNVAREQRFRNVHVVSSAVGDSAGPVLLFMPGRDDGQASLRKHRHGSWAEAAAAVTEFECPMIRLDEYVPVHVSRPIDFIKCDIEGAELPALRGAADTLARQHPLIFCEVCAAWSGDFGYGPADLAAFLRELGYDTFCATQEADAGRFLRPVEPSALTSLGDSRDLLCAVRSKHSQRLRRVGCA